MKVFAGHADAALAARPTAVAIGVFDGMHLGHQALIAEVARLSRQPRRSDALDGRQDGALRRMAYTFHPHPARLLRPAVAPLLLEPIGRRLERLAAAGIEAAVVQPFNPPLAAMGAADFFHQVLRARLGAQAVVVGEGFRFGRGQEGQVGGLRALGGACGVSVTAVAHVRQGGVDVSSTQIRACLHAGQVDGAALLLGRYFEIAGPVVKGAQRGRTLGFPTANCAPNSEVMPAHGVYAAWARLAGRRLPAVVNVGTAPTFGASTTVKVEAHLLEHDGSAFYGAQLALEMVARVRQERRFDGAAELIAQVGQDIVQAQALLAASNS